MIDIAEPAQALEADGFAVLVAGIPSSLIEALRSDFDGADTDLSQRSGQTFGARNILQIPSVLTLAALPVVEAFTRAVLRSNDVRAVRGIFFDKTPAANWPVAWHQDLSLALAARHDLPEWSGWSVKAGVVHAQPPADLLARMVTLRVHLDSCGEDNGPLRVVPKSHRAGRLERDGQVRIRECEGEITVCAKTGDIIAIRPLLLHASSAARNPSHRRVVHLEFAARDLLPEPLHWAF